MFGQGDVEKLTRRVMGNPNVVTEATHLPESGLPCKRKVSISAKFRDFWTPLVGSNFAALEPCSWEVWPNPLTQHCKMGQI